MAVIDVSRPTPRSSVFANAQCAVATVFLATVSACSRDDHAGDGDASDADCSLLDNEPASQPVTFHLFNAREEVIILDSAAICAMLDPQPFVQIDAVFGNDADAVNAAFPVPQYGTWPGLGGSDCRQTCEDIQAGDCSCRQSCTAGPMIRVEPGGSYASVWPGLLRVPQWIEDECLPDGPNVGFCPSGMCEAERPWGPGTYAARVREVIFDCTEGTACDCTPNADGWCTIAPLEPGSVEYTQAFFDYPVSDVTLALE